MVKNTNGVMVPVCDSCYRGNHNTSLTFSNFTSNPQRSDCKVTMVDSMGNAIQCCCGINGEKLERRKV